MADFKNHKFIGGTVGGTTAFGFAVASNQPQLLVFAETLGGYFAGQSVGTWPDVLEPGISSYHRGPAHAIAPALASAKLFFDQAPSLQASLRSCAQLCFQTAAASPNGFEQFVNVAAGFLLHMAAGAVPAVPASYLSHIALDAPSPRGLPLLMRGF